MQNRMTPQPPAASPADPTTNKFTEILWGNASTLASDHLRAGAIIFYGLFEGASGLRGYQMMILSVVFTWLMPTFAWLFWWSLPVAIMFRFVERIPVIDVLFLGSMFIIASIRLVKGVS